jgi:TolB-like protein
MRRSIFLVVMPLFLWRQAIAETPMPAKSPTRILVYKLQSSEQWAPLAKDLSEGIVARVEEPAKKKGMVIVSEGEVALLSTYIKERADLSEEDCRKAEACLSRISQAAEANKILYGNVHRLGDSFVGVLTLLDATNQAREATKSCIAGTKDEFTAQMLDTASEILGLSPGTSTTAQFPPLPVNNQKIAVIPLTGLEDDPFTVATLTDLLSEQIEIDQYSVLSRDELLLILRDARERRALLDDQRPFEEILMPLAGAKGADYLATGHVAKLGQSYIIVLKLISISEARAVRRVVEPYRGPTDYLPSAMKYATRRLLGREMSGVGDLSIITDVKGEYRVDRGGAEALPQAAPLVGLSATKHELSISAEGYYNYSADLYVEPGLEPIRFRPALEELPREWYEEPIFWGIVGVAVAGATTAILLATVPPDGADSGVGF